MSSMPRFWELKSRNVLIFGENSWTGEICKEKLNRSELKEGDSKSLWKHAGEPDKRKKKKKSLSWLNAGVMNMEQKKGLY